MLSKKVERFKSGIYKITNLVNNKFYVGSSVNLYNRKHTHSTYLAKNLHHNPHLQSSYNKYGKDNFLFEVIEYCNKETLEEREQYYMDTLFPQYNIRSDAKINIGLKKSIETREKISRILRKKHENHEINVYKQQHKWKVVEQYSLSGEFIAEYDAPHVAEQSIGSKLGNITRAVGINHYQHMGYQWKYKNSDKIIYNIEKYGSLLKGVVVTIKNIIDGTTEEFHSIAKLCEAYNFPITSIEKVLKRKNKIYKNTFTISYANK